MDAERDQPPFSAAHAQAELVASPDNAKHQARGEDKQDPSTSATGQTGTSLPTAIRGWTDRALDFLSTASNETLGACLVGLGATTYLILGRIGLVVIGVAGGVVLHATWETAANDGTKSVEARRKEVGLDVIHRVLTWREEERSKHGDEGADCASVRRDVQSKKKLDFEGFQPQTKAALEELTDATIRDYVKWWYNPILPDEETFPRSSQRTLVAFLLGISNQMSRKRPADVFLDFLTHSSSILTVFFNELYTATSASPNAPVSEAIDTYLKIKSRSSLANIVDVANQGKKLMLVADDILECYLDPKVYNCEPARVFLQQMLAKVCIEYTVIACSKPEFINGWIVYLLEEGEPELMKEIDAGVEGVTDRSTVKQKTTAESTVEEGEVQRAAHHKRVVSKAQEAMDEAMKEAQRLSQMIAEHEAEKSREQDPVSDGPLTQVPREATSSNTTTPSSSGMLHDDKSESTTKGIDTPTSSGSDVHDEDDPHTAENVCFPERNGSLAESTDSGADRPASFTSFDQLDPNLVRTESQVERKEVEPLTLHNAKVTLHDDSDPSDRKAIKQKPNADYMIQIEPSSSQYPGWMIVRKFIDFENLHWVLGRIAKVSGASVFAEAHPTLPGWKGRTASQLREDLERYLMDAVRFQSLAESEGMKRFLEKEQALSRSPGQKGGFGWPSPAAFESMGKGVVDALSKAPKEAVGGGKAFIGGVSSVLGGAKGTTKSRASPKTLSRSGTESPTSTPRRDTSLSIPKSRPSQDSARTPSPVIDTQPAPIAQMEQKPVRAPEEKPRPSPRPPGEASSVPALGGDQIITLPPLPSTITDEYDPNIVLTRKSDSTDCDPHATRASTSAFSDSTSGLPITGTPEPQPTLAKSKPKPPLSEQETQVAVELLFATIQELYTLSSAWTLRRTLLSAAKAFLLRPGNPQLLSIRDLLQSTVLDANTSDAGIALQLKKLRLNALPTEEELKLWPPEPSAKEKEELRRKARKLLVERGMPSALTGVMGMAATSEALGRVFDALQVERVARGIVFGLMLQALRVITQ